MTYDIGGRGHRAKKSGWPTAASRLRRPGVFERLGIEMTNAIVRNARAKLVERRFEDVKNYISRCSPYLHRRQRGREAEPPKGRFEARGAYCVPTDAEVIAAVDTLIEGYHELGDDYGGSVAEDKGKSRIQVWHESLPNGAVRPAAPPVTTICS